MKNAIIQQIQSLTGKPYIHYLLLLVLLFLVLFLKLGSFHMRMWDESMFAVNTYEMIENGNYFSLYYDGLPDFYNTKPPLTNWLQVICVKLFGYNELAIRIPSATAALFTILFMYKFVVKHFDYLWAWATAIITVSAAGFVGYHMSRTGESDAILTFFLLLVNLTFIKYILEGKERDILFGFIFLTLAFAAKLYAAFLFIPAYIFILFYYKKFKSFVANRYFVIGLLLFLGLSFSLLYMRELESPNYFNIIWHNDAGRLFTVPEAFQKSTFYYIENFFEKRFSLFFLPFILGSMLIFFKPKEGNKQKILFMSFCFVFSYLLIISLSVTKLPWYDMPLYPFLAFIAAFSFIEFINYLIGEKRISKPMFAYGIIAVILCYPYYFRFSKSQGNKIDDGAIQKEANERYIHQAIRNGTNLDGLKVLYRSYNGPLLFYKYKLHEAQQEISLHNNISSFHIGDKILVCKDEHRDSLQKYFEIEAVDHYQYADVYLLK